jgi:arginyl-tRNA synthetase
MKDGTIDRMIYVVGNEQDYHFKVLFTILQKLGYAWADRCTHLSYGMVDLPTGKMKSREGTTVDIDNMLEELGTLVDQEMEKRELKYDEKEKHHLRESIALAALKYYLLKVDAKSRMIYDPASSLDFQGDTGPYLQYTHARIHSILRRVGELDAALQQELEMIFLEEPEALALLRKLQLYTEWVEECGASYRIHPLALYLSELAQEMNGFYAKHTVLGEELSKEKRAARLQLVAAVAQVLKNGLELLGIEAVERM